MDVGLAAYSRYTLTSLTPTQGASAIPTTGKPTSSLTAFSPASIGANGTVHTSLSLSNPAATLASQKQQIDQSASAVSAGQSAANSATALLAKMKALVRDAQSTGTKGQASDTSQFNALAKQLNQSAGNGGYQGMNLVNDSTASLTVKVHSRDDLVIGGSNLNASAILSAVANASGAASSGVFAAMAAAAGAGSGATGGFSAINGSTPAGQKVYKNLMSQLDSAISTTSATANRLGHSLGVLPSYASSLALNALPQLNTSSAGLLASQVGQQFGSQNGYTLSGGQQQALYAMLR